MDSRIRRMKQNSYGNNGVIYNALPGMTLILITIIKQYMLKGFI